MYSSLFFTAKHQRRSDWLLRCRNVMVQMSMLCRSATRVWREPRWCKRQFSDVVLQPSICGPCRYIPTSVLIMTLNNRMVRLQSLKPRGIQSTPLLPLLLGPLRPGMIAPDKVLSMGKIKPFDIKTVGKQMTITKLSFSSRTTHGNEPAINFKEIYLSVRVIFLYQFSRLRYMPKRSRGISVPASNLSFCVRYTI